MSEILLLLKPDTDLMYVALKDRRNIARIALVSAGGEELDTRGWMLGRGNGMDQSSIDCFHICSGALLTPADAGLWELLGAAEEWMTV